MLYLSSSGAPAPPAASKKGGRFSASSIDTHAPVWKSLGSISPGEKCADGSAEVGSLNVPRGIFTPGASSGSSPAGPGIGLPHGNSAGEVRTGGSSATGAGEGLCFTGRREEENGVEEGKGVDERGFGDGMIDGGAGGREMESGERLRNRKELKGL